MQPYNEQPSYTVPSPSAPTQPAPYVGNQKDMMSFIAMIAGAGLLASSCIPGFSCVLPLFAVIGGIIGLRGANQAVDPNRTRTYSWIAIITGAIFLLFIIAVLVFYGALIFAAIQDASNQDF